MTLDPARKRAWRRLLGWALLLAVPVALAAAWTWMPLREFVAPDELLDRIDDLRGHPLAPLFILAGFLVAGLLLLPVTPMVVIAIATFSPLVGFGYALLGVTLLAVLAFAAGRWLGRGQLERLAGSPVHGVSQRLANSGVLAITVARMVPLAHFTLVSLTAGASHIRWRDFVVGTVLGMIPGLGAIALLFDRAATAVRNPGTAQTAALLLASGGILAALIALRVWVRRR